MVGEREGGREGGEGGGGGGEGRRERERERESRVREVLLFCSGVLLESSWSDRTGPSPSDKRPHPPRTLCRSTRVSASHHHVTIM